MSTNTMRNPYIWEIDSWFHETEPTDLDRRMEERFPDATTYEEYLRTVTNDE